MNIDKICGFLRTVAYYRHKLFLSFAPTLVPQDNG